MACWCRCAALLCALAAWRLPAGAEALLLHVSPSGDDRWSGRSAEPNAARTDGPLASLAGARDAVGKLKAAGADRSVEVRLHGGTYTVPETVVFEPGDSGTEAAPIAYVAAPGETPVLSGGTRITGFRPWRGSIVCANLPGTGQWSFRSLFRDGERQIRARHPNRDPADPYRKGFLYSRPGSFGVAVGAAHNAGDGLEWPADIPAAGEYAVWFLYAHNMKALGREDMAGQTSLAVDEGEKVVLTNLPDTGGWRNFRWSKAGSLTVPAGRHTLRWRNDRGGGFNCDAFVLCDDPAWTPDRWRLPAPAAGRHLVVIEGEHYSASHGLQIVTCGGLAVDSKTAFPFPAGELDPAWAKAPEAEVHIFPSSPTSCRAFNEVLKLEAIDTSEGVARVGGKEAAVELCSGDRYFVENLLEVLDSPGEWYLDRAAGRLYYWPPRPLAAETRIVAPHLGRMIELRGTTAEPVHHLRLAGLALRETDYTPDDGFVAYGSCVDGVITLRQTHHVAVEDCRIENLGKAAIHSDGDADNRFVGNLVRDGAEGGIYLANSTGGTLIADNHLHHLGWVYKHVAGIATRDTVTGAVIAHNLIHDTTRWGISVSHTKSTNNVVEYNHLHHLNTETYDTGGLEVTQQSRDHRTGSIFRYNLIHDTGGYSSMMGRDMWNSWGIYLDSFAGGFTVHGNVVYRAQDGGLMVQGGKDNKVFNNVFVDNGPRQQVLIANFANNSTGTEFTRNVVAWSDPAAVLIYSVRNAKDSISAWDRNLYWLTGGDPRVFYPGNDPYAQWFRPLDYWRGLGFDQHSRIADPQFVDPAKDDYRLKDTSPAYELGFERLDLSTVGPRPR